MKNIPTSGGGPGSPEDDEMSVTSVANWYGSCRMMRDLIGQRMGKRSLIVVPFAGGMSELTVFQAQKFVVNDLHGHVVNLAQVMADPALGPGLYRALRRQVFSPQVLESAQKYCRKVEDHAPREVQTLFGSDTKDPAWVPPRWDWAASYAICTWMTRGGSSGQNGEFNQGLPVRYSPNGGGSAQRFHNWVASIPSWRRILRLCEITCEDAFDVIQKCHDSEKVGIYCDAPWDGPGKNYAHAFREAQHRRLADLLHHFEVAKVIIRYGDTPLIRSLYPEDRWTWHLQTGRAQTNNEVNEVVIERKAA